MQERCKIGVVIGNANSPHAVKIMKGIDQASKECDVQLMYFYECEQSLYSAAVST